MLKNGNIFKLSLLGFCTFFLFSILNPALTWGEPVKVKLGATPGFLFLPAYVAHEEGYFEKEGLKVEIIDFQGGAEVTTAMVGGSIDVAATMAERPFILQAKGFKAKNLVSLQDKLAFTLILRGDIPAEKGKLQALKGLKIGISRPGGGLDRALRALIIHAGLKPDQDTPIIAVGTNGLAALESKSVEGLMSAEPTTSMAVYQQKIAKIFVDFRKGEAPPVINQMTFASLQATDKFIQSNPLTVEKIITAITKVERDLRKNPKLAIKAGKKMLPAIKEDLLETIVKEESSMYHPAISKEAIESINTSLLNSGEISKPLVYEDVVAVQFSSKWQE